MKTWNKLVKQANKGSLEKSEKFELTEQDRKAIVLAGELIKVVKKKYGSIHNPEESCTNSICIALKKFEGLK